jgi:hypothetical protein
MGRYEERWKAAEEKAYRVCIFRLAVDIICVVYAHQQAFLKAGQLQRLNLTSTLLASIVNSSCLYINAYNRRRAYHGRR